jgi:hypothetical protein
LPRRLFALDQNFPESIVVALNEHIVEAEIVPVRHIDSQLAEIDDWELLLALHHHERSWDGLITTDSGMLNQARELAVVQQTNLSLVVAREAGHDPIKATGLLFTHLAWICRETRPDRPQVWDLVARNRPGVDPSEFFEKIARHTHRLADEVWRDGRLTAAEFARNPLAL